jgi:hypothetical protein
MTHQIYSAISQTEAILKDFRGEVVSNSDTHYVVSWTRSDEPDAKTIVEIIYENGGVVGCVLENGTAQLSNLMNIFMKKLECDVDQMEID